jgi:hypothetical protein
MSFDALDFSALNGSSPRPVTAHDQLPNNADTTGNANSPEIRQSDGKKITPY